MKQQKNLLNHYNSPNRTNTIVAKSSKANTEFLICSGSRGFHQTSFSPAFSFNSYSLGCETSPKQIGFLCNQERSRGFFGSMLGEGRNLQHLFFPLAPLYIQLNKMEETQMATIKDSAEAYQPKQTLNIADLGSVDVNLELEDRTGKDDKGNEFSYQVFVIESQEYRVPAMVLEKLKEALKIKPDIKRIKVNRSGSGLNTRYSVEVLE